jgi:hypothetical protein
VTSETEESVVLPGGTRGRLGRGWLPAFVFTRLPAHRAPSAPSSDEAQASPPTVVGPFVSVVRRELRLAVREGGDAAMIVAFFVLAVILLPFGVGPAPKVLSRVGSGVVWVTALLAALLSLDRLFLVRLRGRHPRRSRPRPAA